MLSAGYVPGWSIQYAQEGPAKRPRQMRCKMCCSLPHQSFQSLVISSVNFYMKWLESHLWFWHPTSLLRLFVWAFPKIPWSHFQGFQTSAAKIWAHRKLGPAVKKSAQPEMMGSFEDVSIDTIDLQMFETESIRSHGFPRTWCFAFFQILHCFHDKNPQSMILKANKPGSETTMRSKTFPISKKCKASHGSFCPHEKHISDTSKLVAYWNFRYIKSFCILKKTCAKPQDSGFGRFAGPEGLRGLCCLCTQDLKEAKVDPKDVFKTTRFSGLDTISLFKLFSLFVKKSSHHFDYAENCFFFKFHLELRWIS